MKSKIEEILYKHSERVGLYEGGVITCVDENEFDEIAQEIVKLFAIPRVIKSVCGDCLYYLTCNHKSRDKQICDNYDNEP